MGRSLITEATTQDAPAYADDLHGRTVYLIGDYLRTHLTGLARALLDQHGVERVVLLTESDETAQELLAAMREDCAAGRLRALATHGAPERGIELARARFGDPRLVVCTPFRPLLRRARTEDGGIALEAGPLEEVVAQQVMHHARVAQQLAQVEGVRLTIVMPTAPAATGAAGAMALSIRAMLRAFTAAMEVAAQHGPLALAARHLELVSSPDHVHPAAGEAAVRAFVTAALASAPRPEIAERLWCGHGATMTA